MREMKDSNISWVGMIPNNWEVLKNKHCFNLTKEIVNGESGEIQLLSLSTKGIIKKDIKDMRGKIPESFDTYQKVEKGQLVICLFDLDISAVFSDVSHYDGMISPAYKVFDCKPNILNRYAKYWFDLNFVGRKYKMYSKSLRYVVNSEEFGPILILVPPMEEQKKIANYLDEKIIEINSVIKETENTIESYKKYKQSIIFETVTKGLNTDAEMVDSKYEWYEFVPSHWRLEKVKSCFDRKKDTTHSENPVVLSLARNGVKVRDISTNEGQLAEDYSNYNHVQIGDLLLNPMDLISGDNCSISEVEGVISPAYFNLGAKDGICSKYYHYLFKTLYWNKCFFAHGKGVSYQNRWTLNWDTFSQMKILVPPIDEQEEIIKYLDKKCNEIDTLIEEKQSLIKKLEDYKKSLIYECVTGKREIKE